MNLDLPRVLKRLAHDVDLDSRSLGYCLRRLSAEGPQFLTITLPRLSKAVLRSLELGYFERPTEFAWKGRSLRYFSGLLNGIFDSNGNVRRDVDPYYIWRVRQFCEYFYKLAVPYTDKKERKAERDYLSCERELMSFKPRPEWVNSLWKFIVYKFPCLATDTIVDVLSQQRPRFTNGSFAGSSKYGSPYYITKLLPQTKIGTTTKDFEGISGYFKPYPGVPRTRSLIMEEQRFAEEFALSESPKANNVTLVDVDTTPKVAEVLFVPKDSRKPRVISKEPLHQLRLQMTCFDYLSKKLEYFTQKRVNFTDQTINRELARVSSKDKKYATLDLKEASDRVSYVLASRLFEYSPVLSYFLRARSVRYQLPSGNLGTLNKMSGMGSGLTFSIMALIIYSSVVHRIQQCTPKRLHKKIEKSVYVYGDDLVVPTKYVKYAVEALGLSGLMINSDKCYSRSHFRESCGGDYFDGCDVSPVRLKLQNSAPYFRGHFSLEVKKVDAAVLAIERHCRELVRDGLLELADYYYKKLEDHLGGPLPEVSGDSNYLGRYNILSVNYPTDSTGLYATVDAHCPVPTYKSTRGLDPYKVLSAFLKPREVTWKDAVFPGLGSLVSWVTVPRQIKIIKRSVSSFALMA